MIKNKKINKIIDELTDQYLESDRYNRPWIIGFSGGKDSTVLLTLVWLALIKIRDSKPINKAHPEAEHMASELLSKYFC